MVNIPIPGESLTQTPNNAIYEQPPQMDDVVDVMAYHLENLSDENRMDSAMQMLQRGLSIQDLVQGITRNAVANGIHTVDMSVMVAPVIHEYIKTTADTTGIKYDEGQDFQKVDVMDTQRDAGKSMATISRGAPVIVEDKQEVQDIPEPEVKSGKGLMSRPGGR